MHLGSIALVVLLVGLVASCGGDEPEPQPSGGGGAMGVGGSGGNDAGGAGGQPPSCLPAGTDCATKQQCADECCNTYSVLMNEGTGEVFYSCI